VIWLVLRETLALLGAGIFCGVPAVIWLSRYAKSLVFGGAPADPLILSASVAVLAGVASRAAEIAPITALRYE
jgi:putative ABC transport system permease protein